MKGNTKAWYLVGGIVVVLFLLPLAWAGVETTLEWTSTPEFCASCHVMEPMVSAYYDSVHGGNNPVGVRAECTDCHLPHNNALIYLAAKSETGMHDMWITWFTDETALDWQANRERRDEYVYDSGCLQCHENLAEISAGQEMHAKYFAGLIDAKCVDCHAGVGHENLNRYLLSQKYR